MTLLDVKNLHIRFAGRTAAEDVHAVQGLSFTLRAGECLAIVGESGSGKSATARALVGLSGETAEVRADHMRLGASDLLALNPQEWRGVRGRHIGFVLQDALVSLDPLKRIGAEVGETLREHRLAPRSAIPTRVADLLTSVGIPDPRPRMRQFAHQLSGGLRQRALISSAISGAPEVLIADEPTTALDVIVQDQILTLLAQMKAAGQAIILISHDLAVVGRLADHIIVLKQGEVVESGPPAQVLGAPQALYTQQLLAAIPSEKTRGKALTLGAAAPARAAAGADVVIAADGVSKGFGGKPIVKNVSFTIRQRETLGLVGASGSGKTTLARLVLGLERPDSGTITLRGAAWSELPERARRPLRPKVQLVSQDPASAFDPRHTVGQIMAEALELAGVPAKDRAPRAGALLGSVGLTAAYLSRRPRALSGGQRQRIAIARALAMEPDILICDEPVSALDVSTQAQVLDLLEKLRHDLRLTMLFVSHDLGVIRHVSDRVLVMNAGEIVEEGSVDQVFNAPAHPYTQSLLAALPDLPKWVS
ncbi:dipeptide ABC transporter ATP-binding protein [Ketogulonicigenium vulgare]|uniref:ATPase component of various ABC-type transport systems with duplicated ATPase domain protein n=1 Tax=Ketogulonicigenium vulgare (strain WSH-001) TaxID=759362 RepID=F9Y5Z0_KETVW|nr:ABC transporter ATP-binding protein [Ketogulonicigenium vulgare]ADO42624.1 peptide ABC transporter ATP-binding protein [Ketogulonicigenium vulgare Y25]AEM40815.1 ATPase component of various ABC-type transport systems with duplicated ATPase domain protein [Ketogulonicigenium vulgare WSH-001]ALJ80980.1 ABC transporter ATP-binding protein [Ketogulonicigenium vulgare]ANW33745.1 ABC transporter ATP-binding protein [Ketogulonicigenium vulgare]AOZ54533.1 peptide ABC transporter ATP-binding protein